MATIFRPATWNPSDKGSACTLSNGNLTAGHYQTNGTVRSTKSVSSGKWYFEVTWADRTGPVFGVATGAATLINNPGADAYGWGYVGSGYKYHDGGYSSCTPATVGDVIGIAVDADAGTMDVYKNGSITDVTFTGLPTPLYAITGGDSNGAYSNCTVNFGATAFSYSPPSGYYAGFGDIVELVTGTASATLPVLGAFAENAGPTHINFPQLQFSVSTGLNAAAPLPMLEVGIRMSGYTEIELPFFRTSIVAHDSTGENSAEITIPSLEVSTNSGATSTATLPAVLAGGSGTVTALADSEITLPQFATDATVRVSSMVGADISLPSFASVSYSGSLCSITIAGITSLATGVTGSVGGAVIELPLFEATAVATSQATGSANITLPILAMGATFAAAVTLPGLTFTAIGSAVITATYEAYAVNLKHSSPDATDETTRYTNFPFTHVVRYKNSYYGANSTGLYLLEGTTDDATPITFAVKTAMTDFKSPTKKTLGSAYFGGRFGPASTVQLHAGEQTPNSYSYSTPRDTLAQNYRQVFGKGIKERYYAMSVSGTGTLELDSIELDVHNLTRRI